VDLLQRFYGHASILVGVVITARESAMDLLYVSIVVIFFAATAALVYGCERLGRSA
jgi:hypothetical protein